MSLGDFGQFNLMRLSDRHEDALNAKQFVQTCN